MVINMTKIDIVSGFLGAGKTTLIKKLLKEAFTDTKVVLIENEFGEIGIDSGFLKEAGIEIKEMNSGCICCSLVGDFGTSLHEVLDTYHPERILIEPSGVGKLSDVLKAVENVLSESEVQLSSAVAVVDASKCRMYIKNFGEFFTDQIQNAGTIILSRTKSISEDKLTTCISMIRKYNEKATIITTPWEELEGNDILQTFEGATDLEAELMEEVHHQHDVHQTDVHQTDVHQTDVHHEGCSCGCHDHDDGHNHAHDHDQAHNHEHHHHHNADDIFTSWGIETPAAYTIEEIEEALLQLEQEKEYGFVLRAKGMVSVGDGTWVHFDYVPGECNVRKGKSDVTGKICVIGSKLQKTNLEKLFRVS